MGAVFNRSVNPILTRGTDYAHPITIGLSRFLHGVVSLEGISKCARIFILTMVFCGQTKKGQNIAARWDELAALSCRKYLNLSHCEISISCIFAILSSSRHENCCQMIMERLFMVKFIYSEKATKFCKISTIDLTITT